VTEKTAEEKLHEKINTLAEALMEHTLTIDEKIEMIAEDIVASIEEKIRGIVRDEQSKL